MTQRTPAPASRLADLFNDEDSNTSANPHFDAVLAARLSRRAMLRGTVGMSATALVGGTALVGCASDAGMHNAMPTQPVATLSFEAVGKSMADRVIVPPGYRADILYALGDPLAAGVPAYRNDGTDGQHDQRAGDHHDGMEFFGLSADGRPDAGASQRGLIAMNHEATTDEKLSSFFLHADGGGSTLPRRAAEVDKELMIHGLSVVEIQRGDAGWRYRADSAWNRRVTTMTEAVIHGPARGSDHLVTRYSADGIRVRGTLNNCGAGKTPWGTYASGEENWFGYFTRDARDDERRGRGDKSIVALDRYGRRAGAPSRHGWESAGPDDRYTRWNNGATGASAREDFRNEMNTFGYIVEIDAYDRTKPLRKRSALGRMGHENVVFAKVTVGQPVVAYMGDDSRGEYIYKFVSEAAWRAEDANPADRLAAGDRYLDRGTLYVARFNADGTGDWLELSTRNPMVTANPDFPLRTEADIAIFTRLAADGVGATKMDRPEWAGINPRNGEVYITLTNNSARTVDGEVGVDAANPRAYRDRKANRAEGGNVNGHIVRLAEPRAQDARFRWDIYLFAAEADGDAGRVNLSGLDASNDLSSPDGLVFSKSTGICWIETDDGAITDRTNCMLMAAVPGQVGDGGKKTLSYTRADGSQKQVDTWAGKAQTSATLKRFLVGPKGAEITGITETPDGRALFVNIQHPGELTKMADVANPDKYESQWPSNAGYGAGRRPRSATVVITRIDGGRIGA